MSENIKKRKIQKGGSDAFEELGKKSGGSLWRTLTSPLEGVYRMGKGFGAPFSKISELAVDGAAGAAAELSPLDAVKQQLEDSKSPEQKAMEKFKGQAAQIDGSHGPAFEGARMFAEPAIWDKFYDEPCWINPETGSFELQVALEELWHKWYLAGDVKKIAKEVIGETPNEGKTFDMKQAYENYLEEHMPPGAERNPYTEYKFNKEFNKIMAEIMNTGMEFEEALEELGIYEYYDGQIITEKKSLPAAAASGDLTPGEAGQVEGNKDWSKWAFCFLFKFIMGPVGPLILKLMPYFFKFLFTVIDFFQKIILLFTSPFIFYKNRDGEPRLQMNFGVTSKLGHIVGTYFGTVIPINLFSHKYGEILGKGQFGKLIFSMAVISAGIILLGYISVFVFLLVFALYCGKTVSMFGDNIDEQKKK